MPSPEQQIFNKDVSRDNDSSEEKEERSKAHEASFSLGNLGDKLKRVPGMIPAVLLSASLRGDVATPPDYLKYFWNEVNSGNYVAIGSWAGAMDHKGVSAAEEDALRRAAFQLALRDPGNLISETRDPIARKGWFPEAFNIALSQDPPRVVYEILSPTLRLGPHGMDSETYKRYAREKREALVGALKKSNPQLADALFEIIRFDSPVKNNLEGYDDGFAEKEMDIRTRDRVAGIFLGDIISRRLSLEEAFAIARDDARFYQSLLEVKESAPYHAFEIAQGTIHDVALRMVQTINDQHDEADSVRFESVEKLPSKGLLLAMVHGEEEIFTSTFNGLFNRMIERMGQENISGKTLLFEIGSRSSSVFIRLCSQYGRLDEFFATMSASDMREILTQFVSGVNPEDKDGIFRAVAIAESLEGLLPGSGVRQEVESLLKSEYEKRVATEDIRGEIIYGLLSSVEQERAVSEQAWFESIRKKYQLQAFEKVSSKDLFDSHGVNVQQYFFYNDGDGQASFASFIRGYEKNPKWKVTKEKQYIRIDSIVGKKIRIYANQPEFDREGIDAVSSVMQSAGDISSVIVHRGHSFHAQKTLNNIGGSAKIVFLGSCGGYRIIGGVLEKSPHASILSTKGTGTMTVNDPLLQLLNTYISKSGDDIVWKDFWGVAESQLGENVDFKKYISPEKNLSVSLTRTYQKFARERGVYGESSNKQ